MGPVVEEDVEEGAEDVAVVSGCSEGSSVVGSGVEAAVLDVSATVVGGSVP